MNWYIGQKIVAIENHPDLEYKEGDIFTIKGLKQGCCSVWIHIPLESKKYAICMRCNKRFESKGVYWTSERRFAPLDEMQAHESAIKELLKENEIYETNNL